MELIASWRRRPLAEKWLDALGLLHQGFAVPWCAGLIGFFVLPSLVPAGTRDFLQTQWGLSQIPGWVLFLLPFTVVDYLYYWNHRLLHRQSVWLFHRVHHSAMSLDVWMTSRNSFWTPFLLIYVWVHAFLIFAVPDPTPYVWGMLLHGTLDLWRHSGRPTPAALRGFGALLILPEDHSWHHSRSQFGVNFGANLSVWDRLHGTLYRPGTQASEFGEDSAVTFTDQYLAPWRIRS